MSASHNVTGVLFLIEPTQQITATFKKREFVLEVQDGMYTEYIKLQAIQDRESLLDPFKVGDTVTVHFNLKGKPYTKDGKTSYFTNIDAWKIEAATAIAPVAAPVAAPTEDTEKGTDDMPF